MEKEKNKLILLVERGELATDIDIDRAEEAYKRAAEIAKSESNEVESKRQVLKMMEKNWKSHQCREEVEEINENTFTGVPCEVLVWCWLTSGREWKTSLSLILPPRYYYQSDD